MDEVSRYDYHLSRLMAVIVAEYEGETSPICDSDIEAAKEIARACCGEEKDNVAN